MEKQLRLIALAVFLIGLSSTFMITALLFAIANEGDRQFFEANARNATETVVDKVETSVALLRGVAGLIVSQGPEISAEEFRAYMSKVDLREHYAGIQGIGFTRSLAPDQRERQEQLMRQQGFSDFRIWPEQSGLDGGLHSILFLEPMDARNRAALGYNMFSEPVRRQAMTQARDTGQIAMTEIVELVQEIDERKQPGFLLYLPVYENGMSPDSPEERREQLLGFSYAPIRAVDFLSGEFEHQPEALESFEVYHGTQVSADNLLYAYSPHDSTETPRYVLQTTADLAGLSWTFVFRSTMRRAQSLILPSVIAAAGLAVSALLAMLFWREANSRGRVQHALEREQAARGQAERANRMKDQFLATLSHELRTPLTAIVGWAEVLRHGPHPEERLQTGLNTIDRNARSQARLIDDLLDMSRITSGKVSLKIEPVNLNRMLDDEITTIEEAAAKRSLTIEREITSGTVMVSGDPARLQQIIWNLFSNALKFAPEGGKITVSLQRKGDNAQIAVRDNGEGIEPEMLNHIFDHFAQADGSIKRRHGGLGLGLAITRELVVMHGGTIRAESEGIGKGASFILELPLHQGQITEREQEASSDESLDGSQLLVVDDEDDVRELLRVILESHGAEVLCVSSGQEALAALKHFIPSAIISDIGMPSMNGYELMRAIRVLPDERLSSVPAIALTAYARAEDVREALNAGYQQHMTKPVRPDRLRMAIRTLLVQHSAATEPEDQPPATH